MAPILSLFHYPKESEMFDFAQDVTDQIDPICLDPKGSASSPKGGD